MSFGLLRFQVRFKVSFIYLFCLFDLGFAYFKYCQLDEISVRKARVCCASQQKPKKGGYKWCHLGCGVSKKIQSFIHLFILYACLIWG